MKKLALHIIFLVIIQACKNPDKEKPIWQNKKDILSLPNDSLVFTASSGEWKASLQSFTQPIPLKIKYNNKGFILSAENIFGITEGSAILVLSNDDQSFYYELNLRNNVPGKINYQDYRSPKTVNPDSSLAQHRMLHHFDEWRNILDNAQSSPFYEDIIKLNPKAATYRAQKDKALSSFYIQPGSCTEISLKYDFIKQENVFAVKAGPLKDKHANIVANGTKVAFIYIDNEKTYRTEVSLLNGFAIVKIPAEKGKTYKVWAKVHETKSKTIQIQP